MASMPSGTMTIRHDPTKRPAPREATKRRWDWVRLMDKGSAPARKEL